MTKEKQADGQDKKIYEKKTQTPYARLIASEDVSEECKEELKRRKGLYNPAVLNGLLNEAVQHLLDINRIKDTVKTLETDGIVNNVDAAA